MLSHIALQLADRGVIATMVSSADLGTYTLAANFAVPLMLLVMAVCQGFSPTYARAGAEPGMERELATTVVVQVGSRRRPDARRTAARTSRDPGPDASRVPLRVIDRRMAPARLRVPRRLLHPNGGRIAWRRADAVRLDSQRTQRGDEHRPALPAGSHARDPCSRDRIRGGVCALLVLVAIWAHAGPNPVTYRWPQIAAIFGLAGLTWLGAAATNSDDNALTMVLDLGWIALFVVATGVVVFRSQLTALLQRSRWRTQNS